MNDNKKKIKCPSFVSLSALADNELPQDHPDYIHIKSCSECQIKLQKLQTLNSCISNAVLSLNENEIVHEKCIESFRAEIRFKRANLPNYPLIILKSVAVLAIFAGILFYLLEIFQQKSRTLSVRDDVNGKEVAISDKQEIPTTSIELTRNNNDEKIELAQKHNRSPLNSFDLYDFKSAGSGVQQNLISQNIRFQNNKEERAVPIADIVRHNWIWTNKNKPAPDLHSLLKKYKYSQTSNDVIEISLTKEELVKLVMELHNSGFELLSNEEPQPETKLFFGNPSDKVEYEVKLIF